jgi:hypothetical protein
VKCAVALRFILFRGFMSCVKIVFDNRTEFSLIIVFLYHRIVLVFLEFYIHARLEGESPVSGISTSQIVFYPTFEYLLFRGSLGHHRVITFCGSPSAHFPHPTTRPTNFTSLAGCIRLTNTNCIRGGTKLIGRMND